MVAIPEGFRLIERLSPFNALVGQVMKASQGKANPGQVNELLKKKLVR